MTEELEEQIEREGRRRFAAWDGALFRDVCAGPARTLARRLGGAPGADRVVAAYLRLAAEAVGLGHIERAGFDALVRDGKDIAAAPSLLAVLWLLLVPAKLGREGGADQKLALLAELWNLGEGLLSEPAWINRYVTSAAAGLGDLRDAAEFLVGVLEPALVPARAARFEGPFALTVLDGRAVDDELLPGDMHLAAPAVLCVHDRLRPAIHAAVFLRPGRASSFLGLMPCLGDGPAESGLPPVELSEGVAKIGELSVPLPTITSAHEALLAGSGFLVVSAVDSQRLWVVETP